MGGRKRGASLEERLAKIRTSTPEAVPAPDETPEPTVTAAPPETPSSSEIPASEIPASESPASESPAFENASLLSFASIAEPVDSAPVTSRDNSLLGAAAEGDTFLPGAAANRVDVGIAVQAAVAELLPEFESADLPAELERSPEETPLLSKLLGRGRMSARRSAQEPRDVPGEPGPSEPTQAAPPALDAAAEPAPYDVNELEEIIAEIAEITEVAAEPEWVPMRAPIPKPQPPEPREPEPETVLDEVVEPIVAPEPEFHVAEHVRTERFGRIGNTLIERGLISNEQLSDALEVQRISGRRVGDILVELGALSSFELARVLADHMGVPFTDLRTKPPDPVIANLLPEEVARRYDALAISRWNDQLVIAMANPTDLFALDDLQMVTRQPIIAAMAVKEDLRAAIDRVYRVSIVDTVDAAKVDYSAEAAEEAAVQIDSDEGPIVGLVNALMSQAITDHASDLHIEPCSTHIAIRMRIDGVLHDSSTVPLELLRPVISRVKILAGLDIAQNRLAQDGRFSLTIDGRSVDVRAVTMPTAAGEAVILRLLDPVRDALGISSLGLSATEQARFLPAFTASQGAVFIAGPTGSGKTSTIYAVLSEVNTRTKSIVSVENPVEFRLDGIKQMQINSRAGLTFPTALPTVLRSDPDVVFIGEVRDTETARIAADAAITGHLVLSTLHATRAASAPMRLIEMGVEPYLVASALTLVASQRLARRLCELCAVPADAATIEELRALGTEDALLDGATVRRAVGCAACRGTGYRGRLPIFEIMPVTEGISRLILDRASRAQIEDLAVEEGMDTMLRASVKRVVRGDLSVEEMLRVIS